MDAAERLQWRSMVKEKVMKAERQKKERGRHRGCDRFCSPHPLISGMDVCHGFDAPVVGRV